MQKRFPALNPGLLLGIAASLLLHGSLLGVKAFQRPAAEPQFDSGIVSVELTLQPSIAAAPAKPANPEPVEELPEPAIDSEIPLPATVEEVKPEPAEVPQESIPMESLESIEQDGSMEEDKGSVTEAQIKSECAPVYPGMSRRRGEEGVVVLSVDVSVSGKGSNIKVIQSSGHTRLDKAAVKALSKTRFSPAMQFDRPITSTLTQTFNFRLTDE
jgi:protein TonB